MTQILEDAQTLYTVDAPLTFAVRDGATPVSLPSRPGEGEGQYEGDHETRTVPITNAWPLADELSLDREGFQLVHHKTDVDFYDEAERFLSERGINYTIAVLETMDIKEQVRLFAEAKLVIGQHGAGLSNLVASSQSTQVVEAGPVRVPCYSNLAENLLQPRIESNCTSFCDQIKYAVDLAYPEKRLVGVYASDNRLDGLAHLRHDVDGKTIDR